MDFNKRQRRNQALQRSKRTVGKPILLYRNGCTIKRTMNVNVSLDLAKQSMNDLEFQKRNIDRIDELEYREEINENVKI